MFRKNTAGQFVHIQGVDATTGGIKSGVTWTVRRCIDGTFAAATGTVTEDSTNGWYKFAMSQADTNGNDIGFNFTGTGAVPQTVNIVTTACDPTTATNFGITGIPAVATGNAGALLVDGTGTAAISNSSGKVLLQATQSGVTIPTVTTVTNQLTAAAIATGIFQDTTAGDFTAANSVGKSIMNGVALGTGLTVARCTLTDTLTTYTGNTVQTGDSFARIGATGSGLTSLAPSSTALSTATWTGTLATNLGTLAGHDPGATLGTSTLTQTQVTGGAYALNSASFGFNAAMDFTTAQKAATLARVTLTDTVTTYTGNTVQTGDSYAVVNSGTFGNAAIKTDTGNLVTRITATLFSGITSMAQWLGLLAGKQTGNTTARTELRATGAGSGTFDETTDSQEALRDRGDSAWTSAAVTDPLTNTVPGSYAGGTAGAVLGSLLTKPITYAGPIHPSTGTMTLVRGDDYLAADALQLTYNLATAPDLTGATVRGKWFAATTDTAAIVTVTGTVSGAGGSTQSVSFDLPAASSALLVADAYHFAIVATLSNTHTETLVRRTCKVQNPPG